MNNPEFTIIDTDHGSAFSIQSTNDIWIETEYYYYDWSETLSLQNESNSSPYEWMYEKEDENKTVWIYCSGLDQYESITLKIRFDHGYYGYHPRGYNDGLWRTYDIDTEINNGWNLVELKFTWDGFG